MKKMVYYIKRRLDLTSGENIAVLKPDHVSLGKCVTCAQFIRKYATIQSVDVINMLRDGCKFRGFKKINIESSEEEGFVNMHHVLVIDSLDGERKKEVCARRKNVIKVSLSELKNKNEVVTDVRSVVLIVYNPEGFVEFFYFGKSCIKLHKVSSIEESFTVFLASDVLYIYYAKAIHVLNFKYDQPFEKHIPKVPHWLLMIASSNEMLVWSQYVHSDGIVNEFLDRAVQPKLFLMDDLDKYNSSQQMILSQELLTDLINSKILILNVNGSILWVSAAPTNFSVFIHTSSNELRLCKSFEMNTFYPESESFLYIRSCFCSCTQQAFLLYIRDDQHNASSFILVLDLNKMQIENILEMELTLNRKPQLFMYPSTDGSKLFVQETFENRVIFYQVFSLIPSGFSLQNITKQVIWNSISEMEVRNAVLPKKLKDELIEGF